MRLKEYITEVKRVDVQVWESHDDTMQVYKTPNGTWYGAGNKFDIEAKSEKEIAKKLKKMGYELIGWDKFYT